MAKVVMNKSEYESLISGKTTETVDSMLRRFKRRVIEEGKLDDVRNRQFFMKKAVKRREKSKRAKIKAAKLARKSRQRSEN